MNSNRRTSILQLTVHVVKKIIRHLFRKFGYQIHRNEYMDLLLKKSDLSSKCSYQIKDEFLVAQFSNAALQKLIEDYSFQTVLDVGAGAMHHSEAFAKYGKIVTAVDFGVSVYYKQHVTKEGVLIKKIFGDFNDIEFKEKYDLVWASHILEHQPNVEIFLKKLISLSKDNGIIAITAPPLKHEIVGGHVSIWNAGLILYRLVLAGVDCSDAAILSYDYNISVIVRNRKIFPENIEFDCGDIRKIKKYLPEGMDFHSNELDDPFDGNISRLNW